MTAQPTEVLRFKRVEGLLWLDLTRKCQLNCGHCYNSSGPEGTHGTLTREDWILVVDEAAERGISRVQLIGGEPTLHPDAPALARHILSIGLELEVFTNLVRVTGEWWAIFQHKATTLATSYYSDKAGEHDAITRRPSHARTRSNLVKALGLGIKPVVSIIECDDEQRVREARAELSDLGIERIKIDHARPFGRSVCGSGQATDLSALCGKCGTDRAAVGPDGDVTPCVFTPSLSVGNVLNGSLDGILGGPVMGATKALIRESVRNGGDGGDDDDGGNKCNPGTVPEECSPGHAGSSCTPRN
ncbi:radical SAM/SPASM domain-containing protein [Streptomyces qinzhouensis]|uniref:Radical SAM protein n=1 Tax=Streptomyces qinzhouensis TaxID=2599401 RepID=A0A5B8JHM7_9ACTN|nr:radical SAM/SPASM domain-containing protein [Streptomyces qinzhouensis]QDY77300.1 radical SAM protein [Streptomyces qinzhouensis]